MEPNMSEQTPIDPKMLSPEDQANFMQKDEQRSTQQLVQQDIDSGSVTEELDRAVKGQNLSQAQSTENQTHFPTTSEMAQDYFDRPSGILG